MKICQLTQTDPIDTVCYIQIIKPDPITTGDKMKTYEHIEVGTKLKTSTGAIGVVACKTQRYALLEWPSNASIYTLGALCVYEIVPRDPVTFGELEVGDVVRYDGRVEETVVYRNSRVVVLEVEDEDMAYFDVDEKLEDIGRTFIRRGIK